jgi:putative lipoic acid-binding regulatory protein
VGGALSDDERERALALLEATHQFPVDYSVSIITLNVEVELTELRAAVEEGLDQPLGDEAYQTVNSGGGKYTSHRFIVRCQAAADVLALYARIRKVKGVVTVL